MNEKILDPAVPEYRDGVGTNHRAQHATAFPLSLGVPPEELRRRLGDTLSGQGMEMSVYGAQFLLDALYEAGEDEAALGLMTSAETNSWLHLLDDLGATIVAEAWDPSLKSNMTFSHAWASAPANVIPRRLLGVTPTTPGARKLEIKPQPGDLTWVEGSVPTIRGPVDVRVDQQSRYRLSLNLPANVTARVVIPLKGRDPRAFHTSGTGRKPNKSTEDGAVVFSPVGSGKTEIFEDARS